MVKRKHFYRVLLLVIGDSALLYAALVSAIFLRYHPDPERFSLIDAHLGPFMYIFSLWVFVFAASGLYDLRFTKNSKRFLYRLLRVMAANVVIAILFFYLVQGIGIEPRRNLLLIAAHAVIFIFIWRYIFNHIIFRAPSSRVLFFGFNKDMVELADYLLKNLQLGQKPVGFVAENGESPPSPLPVPVWASYKDLPEIVRATGADTIVISRELKENKILVNMLFQVIPMGVAVVEFPSFYEMLTGKIPLSLIGEVWFLENLIGIKKDFYEFLKRFMDLAIASLLLIPVLATFPFIALAIKLDSDGPIFFRQKRVGRNKKIFELIKYRSMVQDAEHMSGSKTRDRDPRQTRVGAFLRKSYFDELPQIVNVLRGEMSFIGPRPERPEYVRELVQKIPFYEMRLLVLPGLTGWAQVHMENDASVEDAPEKMQYDLYYIKNRSFILDLLIALKTIFTLVQRKGR